MKKIRLLTISPTCERGGSDINLLRLLKSLDKNDYDILHLIPYPGPLIDEFKHAGVRVKIVDMPRIRFFKNPLKYIIILLKFFPTVFKIKDIIEGEKIDIVCTSSMVNLYGALAARLTQRPHILIVGEYLSILRLISPYFYLFSKRVVCCSRIVSHLFKKSEKILVRYHSIDLNEFSPQINPKKLKDELCIEGNLVSMVTRLTAWKGIEIFIKAANYIKKSDVKFIVFGQTVRGQEQYLVRLKRMIEKLNLQNKVFIRLEYHNDIPQAIAASDIIVHASLRPEPFGLIILESMASGKPVIASKIGGPREIISDGIDGVLIQPRRPKVLAEAISRLLEDSQSAKEMGLRAREKTVKKFDLKNYVMDFDIIFKSALENGKD